MAVGRNGLMASVTRRRMKARAPCVAPVVAFLVLGAALWLWRGRVEEKRPGQLQPDLRSICDRDRYPAVWQLRADQVTVLVNGFSEERLPLLQRNVRFFSSFSMVHSIFILWGNVSTPDSLLEEVEFSSIGAAIYVVRQQSESLNDRFLPRPYIKTRAVMICDDDISVDGESLEFSFRSWMMNQKQIVGFFPRAHSYELDSKSWIYTKLPNQYSILLTKLMILATEYLFLYTCRMPQGVREYVDKGMNCEDIAMNFVVSNHSGLGPVLVEGKARDWGDTRNSAEELSSVGLSARAGHRKDRGECITVFQKLWGGMKLRFSYGKVSRYQEEQALCDKFGYLINCDEPVASKRHAQRLAGHNLVNVTSKYAYVTVLESEKQLSAALVLAQSLSSTGTVHDLLLLLHPSCVMSSRDEGVLEQHYDVLKKMKGSTQVPRGLEALNAWLLHAYAKVVLLDVNTLVLQNLDHLFNLPEPAGAPHHSLSGLFDTALLVLKPSKSTLSALLAFVRELPPQLNTSTHHVLNAFFSAWSQMPPHHRLPSSYNPPYLFSSHLAALSHLLQGDTRTNNANTSAFLIHAAKPALLFAAMEDPALAAACDTMHYCKAWLQLLKALADNSFLPLANDSVWQPQWPPSSVINNTGKHVWPPKPHADPRRWISGTVDCRNCSFAFATAMWDRSQGPFLRGWAASFAQHRMQQYSKHKTLLLVLSTLDAADWKPFINLFDITVVVDPLVADGGSHMLLQLWNQTSFSKIAYADAGSVFMDNCGSVFDYGSPFAAIPSCFPADTFSTRLMVLEPNEQTFRALMGKLHTHQHSEEDAGLVVEQVLNRYYKDWYQRPEKHRIVPWFSRDMKAAIGGLFSSVEVPQVAWKIWSFTGTRYGSKWESDPENTSLLSKLWQEALCSSQPDTQKMDICHSSAVEYPEIHRSNSSLIESA